MSKYIFLFILLISSCGIFTNYRTITVSLPANSPPWFMDSNKKTGKVLYPGDSGLIESMIIPWDSDFQIILQKGSYIAIACYPSGSLKPAGAVINTDSDAETTIQLKWEDGFLADLLLDLKSSEIETEQLNVARLKIEIKDKCMGNPWSLNRDLLKEAIIYNAFSVYKIKKGTLQDIIVPAEGIWISDNPFYPPVLSNSEGKLIINEIYPGLHRFQNPLTHEKLDILVKEEGYEYLFY